MDSDSAIKTIQITIPGVEGRLHRRFRARIDPDRVPAGVTGSAFVFPDHQTGNRRVGGTTRSGGTGFAIDPDVDESAVEQPDGSHVVRISISGSGTSPVHGRGQFSFRELPEVHQDQELQQFREDQQFQQFRQYRQWTSFRLFRTGIDVVEYVLSIPIRTIRASIETAVEGGQLSMKLLQDHLIVKSHIVRWVEPLLLKTATK